MKKLISWVLALAMLLSVMPMAVFAAWDAGEEPVASLSVEGVNGADPSALVPGNQVQVKMTVSGLNNQWNGFSAQLNYDADKFELSSKFAPKTNCAALMDLFGNITPNLKTAGKIIITAACASFDDGWVDYTAYLEEGSETEFKPVDVITLTFTVKADAAAGTEDFSISASNAGGATPYRLAFTEASGYSAVTTSTDDMMESVNIVEANSIAVSGPATIAAPEATGPNALGSTTASFAAAVIGGDGKAVSSPKVTWTVSPANAGVTVNNGVVTVKSDATAQNYTLTATATKADNAALGADATTTVTFQVTKNDPAAKFVTVSGDESVNVPGSTAAYTAAVYDQYGAAMTGQTITWSVTEKTGVSIDTNGVVTVAKNAAAGSVTVTAKAGDAVGTAALNIVKAASAAAKVEIQESAQAINVPALTQNGGKATVSFTAKVFDQYDAEMNDQNVTWSITAAEGVSINKDTGVVTVTNQAAAGNLTVTASCSGKTDTVALTVTKTAPAATQVEVQADKTIAVPTESVGTAKTTFTAKVYDQYGSEMTNPPAITWSIASAEGVSINKTTGEVTVTNKAAAGDVTVTATCNGKTDTAKLTITKAGSVAAKVEIAPASASVDVPAKTVGQNEATPFTATVYDQFGDKMTAEVTWSIENAPAGVSIDAKTGKVTVGYQAAAGDVTVKAVAGDASATAKLTVNKAASVKTTMAVFAGSAQVTGTDVIGIPGEKTYTAKVYDQFGDEMTADVTFTLSTADGFSISNGKVTVAETAADGAKATLTAACTGLASIAIEITAKQVAVDWTGIAAKDAITYGDTKASAFTTLPATGTATAYVNSQATTVNGTFTIQNADEILDAGDRTIDVVFTVTTEGAYKNSTFTQTYPVTVKAKEVAADWTGTALTYNGQEQAPTAAVTKGLVGDDTLAVTVTGGKTNAGTYTASASIADTNYTLTNATSEFTIAPKALTVNDGTYAVSKVYDGTTAASATGALGLTGIVGSDEVTVSGTIGAYADANVGTAKTVPVNGLTLAGADKGNYTLKSATYQFTKAVITAKAIVEGDFTFDLADKTYTGSAIEPEVTSKLTADKDYLVKYEDNQNVGTATITVQGDGNYTGTVEKTFKIVPKSVSGAEVGGVNAEYPYNGGEEIAPAVTVKVDGKTLALGTDYTVAYASNTALGTATITVTGKGNYTGTATKTFEIVAAPAVGTVTVTGTDYKPGDTLTASVTGTAIDKLSYQWYADGKAISGATGTTYQIVLGDTDIHVVVTSTGNYVGELKSATIEVGKMPLPGTVAVTVTNNDGKDTNGIGDVISVAVDPSLTADDYTVVWMRNGAAISGASGTSYTIAKDDQGTTITAKIVAKGDVYTGEVAGDKGVEVAAVAPDAPVMKAEAGNEVVNLSWTAPYNGGAAITGYQLTVSSSEGTKEISLPASATSYEVTDLTNDVEYTFTLTASNAAGMGAAATATATPEKKTPENVVLLFVVNGGTPIEKVTVSTGTEVDLSKYTTTREGYTFAGWYADADLTEKVTTMTMTRSAFVYAKWIEAEPADLPFADVKANDWFYDAVEYVYNNGIMNGVGENLFNPNGTTNRAMIVTILWRLEGEPSAADASFKDVPNGQWYSEAVDWAAANGIVTGFDANTFGPLKNITREQMAAILYRYADFKGCDMSVGENTNILSFGDAETVSEYAVTAMQWAVGEGLINGIDGNLKPQGTATRAQIATILMRFCEKV